MKHGTRRKRRVKFLMGVAWLAFTVTNAHSQGRPAPEPAAPAHQFEVATVRLTDRSGTRNWIGTRLAPSGRLSVSTMSLKNLVWMAYVGAQKPGTVEGGPKWAETDNYDMEAKVDEA